jgi:copper transport protein
VRRLALPLGVVGIWLAMSAAPASGHAGIERTEPDNGAVLDAAPGELLFAFTEPPDVDLTFVEVIDQTGAPVPTGPVEQALGDSMEIRVPLEPVADGVYTVSWRTVSTTDGHTTTGTLTFGVGVSAGEVPPAGPDSEAETPPPTALSVAGRWGLYAGLAVLFGAGLAGLLAFGVRAVARPRVLGAAWLAAAVGVVAMTLQERASVGVPLGTLLSSDTGAKFVRLAVAVFVAGVATLVVALRPARWSLLALAGSAAAAMLARASAGHAGGSVLSVATQGLHMIAVGAWIGGLAWLVLALRRGLEPGQVRRYSNLAAGGLALLFVSGSLRASNELGLTWWLDPFQNDYSTALVVKLSLVTPLVALGAVNRFRNVRRFAEVGPRPLLRTVGGELALAAAVFATTGILSGLPSQGTGGGEAPPGPLVVTGSDFATTTQVRLRISPGTVGPNTFVAEVTDFDTGEPVDARRVALSFTIPERPEVRSTLELEPLDEGSWEASGTALSLHGTWNVNVHVERADGSVDIQLELTPRRPDQRVEVSRVEGQPDLYTIFLEDGVQIQSYTDPGEPGQANQVHVTAFDAEGSELPLTGAVVMLTPPEGEPFEPELLRFGESAGHFVANVEITPGTWTFDITAETAHGHALSASFEQTFEE